MSSEVKYLNYDRPHRRLQDYSRGELEREIRISRVREYKRNEKITELQSAKEDLKYNTEQSVKYWRLEKDGHVPGYKREITYIQYWDFETGKFWTGLRIKHDDAYFMNDPPLGSDYEL